MAYNLWRKLCENGGFTAKVSNLQLDDAKSGYYVSIEDGLKLDTRYIDFNAFCIAIKGMQENATARPRGIYNNEYNEIEYRHNLIGAWHDKENNLLYLDYPIHTENLQEALHLARINKQKAIYDVVNDCSIEV